MHSTYCGSAIFPYKALERRQAQETSIGCAGFHNEKFEGIELSHWTFTNTKTAQKQIFIPEVSDD
jgi:hypothetical protein